MENSQMYILIASMFLVVSFILAEVSFVVPLILSLLWALGFLFMSYLEMRSLNLKFEIKRLRRELEYSKFESIIIRLDALVDLMTPKKKEK